jgi:hypothetical protein
MPAIAQRLLSRLKHLHHIQTDVAATARLLMINNAIQKILAFCLEWLNKVDIWDQDVAIAV